MAAASRSALSMRCIGVSEVSIEGNRALGEASVAILARAKVGPIEVGVTCDLRFFDRLERCDDGNRRIASRTAIYEKDRIDTVRPSLLYPLVGKFAGFNRLPRPYRYRTDSLVRNGLVLANPAIESGTREDVELRRSAKNWLVARN